MSTRVESHVANWILTALAAVGFAVSFSHIQHLCVVHGQTGWKSWAIAVTVDLLAIASSLELRRRAAAGARARWPKFGILLGVLATLAANLSSSDGTAWGVAIAVWPAIAFVTVAFMFETRPQATTRAGSTTKASARRSVASTPPPPGPHTTAEVPAAPARTALPAARPAGVAVINDDVSRARHAREDREQAVQEARARYEASIERAAPLPAEELLAAFPGKTLRWAQYQRTQVHADRESRGLPRQAPAPRSAVG